MPRVEDAEGADENKCEGKEKHSDASKCFAWRYEEHTEDQRDKRMGKASWHGQSTLDEGQHSRRQSHIGGILHTHGWRGQKTRPR